MEQLIAQARKDGLKINELIPLADAYHQSHRQSPQARRQRELGRTRYN